jgi:urease beta subunit
LELRRKDVRLVHVSGSTTVPGERSGMPTVINLQSKIIDIDKIKKLLREKNETKTVAEAGNKNRKASKTKKENVEAKAGEPVSFDMGKRKYVVNIDLRGIKYNSVLSSQVDGKITAQSKNISIDHLNIFNNKDKLAVNGDFLSTVKGLKYDVKITSNNFNLSPFFYTFLNNEFKALKGTLKDFNVHLKGTGLRAPGLWDNMRGFARSKFVDVKIPNSMSKTMIGKILLLPFETMIEVQKLMPGRALSSISKVSQFIVDFQNDIKVISFQTGKMDVAAENGSILIRDFRFSGNVVRSLSFYGELALGTHPMLDVNSRLDISGIVLPLEIDGTVKEPKINYRKTTVDFMKSNTLNVLDTTGKILKKGSGDVKKVIEGILDI